MGAVRLVIVLLVAAVAAILLALVVRQMTAQPKPAPVVAIAPAAAPQTRVLIANKDLKVGARLTAADVGWQGWPASSVNAAFITGGPYTANAGAAGAVANAAAAVQAATLGDPAVQAVAGSLVREEILANEPISTRKLVKGGEGGFLSIKLPAGMRAVSVPVTVETGSGGFVLPGDRVDVIANIKIQGAADAHGGPLQPVNSQIVLRNITVLAIDQSTEAKAGAAAMVGAVATLEVPDANVTTLAKAKDEGTLILALRSYADAAGPTGAAAPAAATRVRVRPTEDMTVRIHYGPSADQVQAQ